MASDAAEPEQAPAAATEEGAAAEQANKIALKGFSIMCAWHFLMIFTAVFNLNPLVNDGRSVWMQLTLYLALAATYGAIACASARFVDALFRSGAARWRIMNAGIAVLASIASVLVILSCQAPLPAQVLAYVLLGVSGALLIFPWLQLPQITHDKTFNYQNLAFNMGIGSLFAFGISFLQSPVVYIAVCALPLLSNLLLIREWSGERDDGDAEEAAEVTVEAAEGSGAGTGDVAGEAVGDEADTARRPRAVAALAANVHFLFYGLAFGFVQGVYADGLHVSFALNDGWPLLGATLSALVVFFVPAKYLQRSGIFTLQRASMLIMFAGLFVALFFHPPIAVFSDSAVLAGNKVGQALTFGGFNIFEFGFMVFSFTWAARLKKDLAAHIGFNRVALYLGMSAGLGLGFALSCLLGSLQGFYLLALGFTVLLLTFLTLPFFDEYAPYGSVVSEQGASEGSTQALEEPAAQEPQDAEEEQGSHTARWKSRVESIADAHDLSEREREVFFFLAKGRNAAFIQQELWISIHTVKTHIANIYRKLDVHSLQEVLDMVDSSADAPQGGRPDGKEEG